MKIFIKFLVYSLYTIDGTRGSAKKIIKEMNAQRIADHKLKANLHRLS